MDEIENIGSFQLFPNPFNYSATIQTSSYLTYGTLRLYNYLGQLVKQIDRISGQTIILNRDDLPNGVYFLQLIQNNKIFSTKKIVITD
jgi:hypothetical protein